jgi:thiol-disulfide isomerase/thioredoxin
MNRRGIVLGVGGGVAAAAGAGTWLLSSHRARGEAVEDAPADPWSMSFATPGGPPVALSALRGRPLLLNFWATWCGPCATEMPLLDRFAASLVGKRWNVLALAIDEPTPVRRFVAERSLRLPIALAGMSGLDLSRSLGNTAGALPFTVVFDRDGLAVERKLGILDAALLDRWSASVR